MPTQSALYEEAAGTGGRRVSASGRKWEQVALSMSVDSLRPIGPLARGAAQQLQRVREGERGCKAGDAPSCRYSRRLWSRYRTCQVVA